MAPRPIHVIYVMATEEGACLMMSTRRTSANDSGYDRPTDPSPLVPHRSTPPRVMIGQTVPQIGRMAFVRGHCTYLDRTARAGRWLALCFLSSPTVSNLTYLNAQAKAFARDGAALLVVL